MKKMERSTVNSRRTTSALVVSSVLRKQSSCKSTVPCLECKRRSTSKELDHGNSTVSTTGFATLTKGSCKWDTTLIWPLANWRSQLTSKTNKTRTRKTLKGQRKKSLRSSWSTDLSEMTKRSQKCSMWSNQTLQETSSSDSRVPPTSRHIQELFLETHWLCSWKRTSGSLMLNSIHWL